MCGIVAIAGNNDSCSESLVTRLRDALAHRGPDDAGVHVEEGVALGHRRLAILDLSPAGHQPMSNPDGSLWLVFNGEIYNYVELRQELLARGHRLRSQSDSEVLLRLYEEEGEACVHRLRGMFAFAIWDRRRRQLFAARDRLGKKPLYYAVTPGGLVVASEIKALLLHPAVEPAPDYEALRHYLALQYVPSPLTAFRSVKRLPPAHTLTWHAGATSLSRYWSLSYEPKPATTEDEAARRLEDTLRQAVRIRLRADVPTGVLLSGGVDSSLVAALAAEHVPRLKTFTIGFREEGFDERRIARQVASRLGADHYELEARPDLVSLLPRFVRQFDQPLADPAALPTMALAELTSEHVTVALNGDGGDEAFAGYPRYRGAPHWRAFRRLPSLLRGRALWDRVAGVAGHASASAESRLRRLAHLGGESASDHYLRSMSLFNREWLDALVSDGPLSFAHDWDAWRPLRAAFGEARDEGLGEVDSLLAVDSVTYLPDCLLLKVDMAAMAHGLEVRSPLLDHEVFESAALLPESMKLRSGTGKFLLKRVARSLLPASVVDRPKAGFGVPLGRWLRHELRDVLRDTLLDGRLAARGYFRTATVERLIKEHLHDGADRAAMLWCLLVLETWHREVLERPA